MRRETKRYFGHDELSYRKEGDLVSNFMSDTEKGYQLSYDHLRDGRV